MKTRDEVLAILRHEKEALLQRWPIEWMALFGSVARDEATEASDVDVLIQLNDSIGWDIVTLADELESLLGEKVDLITREAIKPRYWERISGEVIYA
jgi:predicted nucleotidyltransferase